MCGINGVLRLDAGAAPPDHAEVVRTRDAMARRGPDGEGLWASPQGGVVLGHRRLAIIDLSEAARQPMAYQDGRYRIVFNGEIYNYRDLRAHLLRHGATLRTSSDTEAILGIYALEGERGLGRLRGMFAFALWDEKERLLLLARDPNGIKPLYYAADGRHLRFASQARALLAGGQVPARIDEGGLCGFLCWGSVPEPLTLWQAIRAVPAGTLIVARPGAAIEERPLAVCEPAAAPTLEAAVEESVTAHLVADVPVGIFLSAGIDSAVVAALAARHLPEPPLAVTLRFAEFEGSADDEAPEAAALARLIGVRHVQRTVTREDFLDAWPAIAASMDQPTIDGINTWLVARAARELGLECALSGLGGDELLGGYASFRQVPALAARAARVKAIPGLESLWPHAAGLARARYPKAAGLLRYGASLAGAYYLRRALFLPEELPGLIGPAMADAGLARYDPVADAQRALGGETDGWSAVGRLETRLYMRNQLLRDADWAAMAHPVEVRVPFVDVFLQQQARRLAHEPARSEGKAALLRAVLPEAPASMLDRPKTFFSVPLSQWLADSPDGRRGVASRHLALRVARQFGIETAAI